VRTSARASWCLGTLVAGYLALAVVAGVPRSPLTVPLPPGARPPSWTTTLAADLGLDRLSRGWLIGLAWILVPLVLAAFASLLVEAWSRRVGLAAVLCASGASLAISVASPVLLSRDLYTYAAYGRVEALQHRNPYVVALSSFPHDPFVSLTPGQWVHGHSHYGPLFTLLSAAIVRAVGSATATILAFKLLAGLAIAAAAALVALTAKRIRPERAPLAAALVGLNPVLVVHTVGGGHVDALIAALLGAALAIGSTRPRAATAAGLAVTVLLTAVCLVKAAIVPVLALWLWRLARTERRQVLAAHVAVVAGATVLAGAPYVAGWKTLRPFATLGGVEAWASPSHLVGTGARAMAGGQAAVVVEVVFLVLFVLLASQLGRERSLAHAWGVALLLLALSMPYLLPWYAAWFAPFLALLADDALLLAGALSTGVLALTLIPADPFQGLTTQAVMDGVHYGAASVLLLVLLVVASRILAGHRRTPAVLSAARAG
jgi:hypothetical protein